MEQDVLEEINIRTECLMEMYQHLVEANEEKPDEAQVNQIYDQFKKKSADMRTQLKEKFKEMRQIIKV
jgi:fructose/tagatose bisphosphate aldolase|tara:strand:+ start:440 stop:643 length:204 start_codon:yes stop_codon:yes gene_type:complete